MKYETSKGNVNAHGRQSLILKGTPLLDHIVTSMVYNEQVLYEPTLTVASILCGHCCELDCIVIGDDISEQSKIQKAAHCVINTHGFTKLKFPEIESIIRTLMHLGLVQESIITWE